MRPRFIVLLFVLIFSISGNSQNDSNSVQYKNTFKLNVGHILMGNAAIYYERNLGNGNTFEVSAGFPYRTVYNSNHEDLDLKLKWSKGITSSLGYTFMSKKYQMHGFQLRLDYKFIQLDSVEKYYEWTHGDGDDDEGSPSRFFPIEYKIGNGRYCTVNMTERRHVLKQQFFWVIRNKPYNKFFFEFYTGPSIRLAVFKYDIHTIWPGLYKSQGKFTFDNYKVGIWHLYPMFHAGFRIGLRT